jgi:hypothetical protein
MSSRLLSCVKSLGTFQPLRPYLARRRRAACRKHRLCTVGSQSERDDCLMSSASIVARALTTVSRTVCNTTRTHAVMCIVRCNAAWNLLLMLLNYLRWVNDNLKCMLEEIEWHVTASLCHDPTAEGLLQLRQTIKAGF